LIQSDYKTKQATFVALLVYNSQMFLYFSDWTTEQNLRALETKGLPHTGRLIKVFATKEDPSIALKRKIITTEGDHRPFGPYERYKWYNRGPWSGTDMEVYLHDMHLPEDAKEKTRALFRFANSPALEIAELAMMVKNSITKQWHYRHPLRIVDGLDEAQDRGRTNGLHLDIFTARSVERLGKIIDLGNPEGLVTIREAVEFTRISPEGVPPTKEARI